MSDFRLTSQRSARRTPLDRIVDLAVGLPTATVVAARRTAPLVVQVARAGVTLAAHRVRPGRRAIEPVNFVERPASKQAETPPSAPAREPDVEPAVVLDGPGDTAVAAALDTEHDTALEDALENALDTALDTEWALPIEGYENLAARQIVDRLAGLTAAELDTIDSYERAHRHRQTVLGRIGQLRT